MPGPDDIDFKFLTEQSVDVICLSGSNRKIRYISPSCFQMLGWKPEELTGKGPEAYIVTEDLHLLDSAGERILVSETQSDVTTVRMRRKDGVVIWVEINVRLVRDPATGEPRDFVIVMRDVTERKMMVDRLTVLALFDGLTRLSNRSAFDSMLSREWKRTIRDGSQLSMLLIDIDHFKELNDRYGHVAGDDCIRAVANALNSAVRASDLLARYGGDELAVILPCTDAAGALKVAEKVRVAIENLGLPHEGNPEGRGRVTVSIGVATAFASHGQTSKMPEALVLAADNALYRAKREGRNRVASGPLTAINETDGAHL